jgi:hypothetical protein
MLQSVLYQIGDIVSIEDLEGDIYFAQIRGFLQDEFAQRSAVITWLIPTIAEPTHFDPVLFLPGSIWPKGLILTQHSGLKITAGQWTMSGQNPKLSGQIFALPVILTGWVTCVFIYELSLASQLASTSPQF